MVFIRIEILSSDDYEQGRFNEGKEKETAPDRHVQRRSDKISIETYIDSIGPIM